MFFAKTMKKTCSKKTCFSILEFDVWGCILEAFGKPLGLSWDALGAKMASKSNPILESMQIFFRFDQFCDSDTDFHQLGQVWGGFLEGCGGSIRVLGCIST